jgi:hypothetical protein
MGRWLLLALGAEAGVGLAARLAAEGHAPGLPGSSPERRLAVDCTAGCVTTEINPLYTFKIYLRFFMNGAGDRVGTAKDDECASPDCASSDRGTETMSNVYAGLPITTVQAILDDSYQWSVTSGSLKVVSHATLAARRRYHSAASDGEFSPSTADNGGCQDGSVYAMDLDVVNEPWDTSSGALAYSTQSDTRNGEAVDASILEIDPSSASELNFRKGGTYKLCYSDMSFASGRADPVGTIVITVNGITTSCDGDNCLANDVNYCYGLKNARSTSGSCITDFSEKGVIIGDVGKASWSSQYIVDRENGDVDSNGYIQRVTPQACGTVAHTAICPGGDGCSGTARNFAPTYVEDKVQNSDGDDEGAEVLQFQVPTTIGTLTGETYQPFTVALCYCPGYDSAVVSGSCNDAADFIQQIGILHFFVTKGCHIDDALCENDVNGVTPQYNFKLWVLCPTDVCPRDDIARIKVVKAEAANDRPWWDGNGCADAFETDLLVAPGACDDPTNSRNCSVIKGGLRQDYKAFGLQALPPATPEMSYVEVTAEFMEQPGESFLFKKGHTNYEMRNFHSTQHFDVCYCLGGVLTEDCAETGEWLKVGIFRFSPLRLVSAATDASDKPTLEYVNYPGTVAFNRQDEDANVLGLQDGGVIKILYDRFEVVDDAQCGTGIFQNSLVSGLTETTAGQDYRGKASTDYKKLIFNNGNPARTLTVKQSGIIALCYCAITFESVCKDPSYWKLVSRLTIKGPDPDQAWTFSTNVVFKFFYTGWGLAATDTLRIIETDGKCTDNEGNPNQADTSIYYNCPDIDGGPKQVSNEPGSEWNFPTELLTSETVDCKRGGMCSFVYIQSIDVLDAHTTQLTFTGDPRLLGPGPDGTHDYITISGVSCGTHCNDEQLAALQGVFQYADHDTHASGLPDNYILAHQITKVSDTVYTIPVGWPDVDPGTGEPKPSFRTTPPGAKWMRRNVASTREEIKGVKEKSNLKVCWSFGGNGKYVMEVGRLNLRDPTVMQAPMVSLSTLAQTDGVNAPLDSIAAPQIISFKTARGAAGRTYETAVGSMQLKLVYPKTDLIEGLFTNGNSLVNDANEDEVAEASQQICGRLFLETWSDDMKNGFPLPKGCYYRLIQTDQGSLPEIGIVFEPKSGLRAGYNYQIVMTGKAKTALRSGPDADPDAAGTYMNIYSMDDVERNPYGAVELGFAGISSIVGRVPGNTDPQFGPRGFELLGGYGGVLELDSDSPIKFELRGGDGARTGKIIGGSWLRIFLHPLTQWKTGVSCDARCVETDESPVYCGQITICQGEAIVDGFQNNMVTMQLPEDMDELLQDRKHTILLGGLTLPSGAIFPGRLAAELRSGEGADTFAKAEKPAYAVSEGDLIWRRPGQGRIVARLVSKLGDGNDKPFRGDKKNSIYFQLMFAGYLKAAKQGDTSFVITLPPNYEIKNVLPCPESLSVFDTVPQGRGTPWDPDGPSPWTLDGNILTYTLSNDMAIYSGASLYIKLVVDNPEQVYEDPADNLWTIQIFSKGEHTEIMATDIQQFIGVTAGYSSNLAVLGKLSEQLIQFSSPIVSTSRVSNTQFLRVFFRTEQSAGRGGDVEVTAPGSYNFGEICSARDLEDMVYSTGPFEVTRRLPDIQQCRGRQGADETNPRLHRAVVTCNGLIIENTRYALRVEVTNPRAEDLDEVAKFVVAEGEGTADALIVLTDAHGRVTQFNDDAGVGRVLDQFGKSLKIGDLIRTVNGAMTFKGQRTVLRADDAIMIADVWLIQTYASTGRPVDGSDGPVPMFEEGAADGDEESELYAYLEEIPADHVKIEFESLLPTSLMDGMATTVTFQWTIPGKAHVQNTLRISLPEGFSWGDPDLFQADAEDPDVDLTLESQRFVLPAPTRRLDGHEYVCGEKAGSACVMGRFLILSERVYRVGATYGFQMPVIIPDLMVPVSTNGFFFEFGYDKPNILDRPIAGLAFAEPIRTLINPRVRYSFNAQSKENTMTFEVQTMTEIPAGGMLKIAVPEGFRFTEQCRPTSVLVYQDNFLPEKHVCVFDDTDKRQPVIRILVGMDELNTKPDPEFAMPPNTYMFRLVGTNPADTVVVQPDLSTECGFSVCWKFSTHYQKEQMGGFEQETLLDLPTSTPGFSINRKMVQARLPLIDEAVRRGTGRNDQPGKENQLIFAFTLNSDVLEETILTLRGPYGVVFKEDCTDGFITAEDKVFGEGNKWPPAYDPWELEAVVGLCVGDGTDARIMISAGLRKDKTYAFRIGVKANPHFTQDGANQWVVDYAGETSEPFDGYVLWTFIDTQLTPVTRARSPAGVEVERVGNALRMRWQAWNPIIMDDPEDEGSFRVTMPYGFTIMHINLDCPLVFESLPYNDADGKRQDGEVFESYDISCTVDKKLPYVAYMRLAPGRSIMNDRPYQFTFEVYNPRMTTEEQVVQEIDPGVWLLESFASREPDMAQALDAAQFDPFVITPVLATWEYTNEGADGNPQVNGLEPVFGLELLMEFPETLDIGDIIEIRAPLGFRLEHRDNVCNNVELVLNAQGMTPLKFSIARCTGGVMTILIMESLPVSKFQQIRYRMDTSNPPKNVGVFDNYWLIEHRKPGNEDGSDGAILSSHAFKGWTIIPQLENPVIRLLGDVTAAGRDEATIEISFLPVSRADTLTVEAAEPIGFEFDLVKLDDPTMFVVSAKGSTISMLADICPELADPKAERCVDVVTVTMRRVKLGKGGGQTVFHLRTMYAVKPQDEKKFFPGFRLPGKVDVPLQRLDSKYSLNGDKYPIRRSWGVLLGDVATATFRFYLSLVVPYGSTLHISGGLYNLRDTRGNQPGAFRLYDEHKKANVPTELVRMSGNDRLDTVFYELQRQIVYSVTIGCYAPSDTTFGNGFWRIELLDDNPLPLVTDDGMTEGFDLVTEYPFKVVVDRCPPSTIVPVRLDIEPNNTRPMELRVIAPPNFNFTTPCLVDGPPEVLACTPAKPLPSGREVALIVLNEEGLISNPQNLVISVITPASTPSTRNWLIEGIFTVESKQVGWGEDEDGINIIQMPRTTVMYPGATGIGAEFAVTFSVDIPLTAGGMVEVTHPFMFLFYCGGDDNAGRIGFRKISLPGEIACKTFDNRFMLAFNHTLVPSDYSFTMLAEIPADIPERTEFSVSLIDRHGQVQDARMNIPGPQVSDNLIARVPMETEGEGLLWMPDTIQPGEVYFFEFKISLEQDVPTDPANPPQLGEILFQLPEGYVHELLTFEDFWNLDDIPTPDNYNPDFTQQDRVRFLVDNGEHNVRPLQIKKGQYSFRFPVRVPMQMPKVNIFVVVLCKPGGGCSSPDDSGVLLTFPLAGPSMGQQHMLTVKKTQSGAFLAALSALFFLF